ncbi:mitochondrial glutamyl-tRNA Gln amidotransferase [Andalucia godoyi]|uniref:Mitochondrial glutamyl-tRNA Gln amidotransferase n=1 Tax=Andalucia godoyi TaxID=505711 RepID=A0A8K0AIM3_ANDGO|nr:mitochondrial glutamyl-tRNA Gln amidotransferase [Andalucia godoyi]|eukprot:ANDGO_08760.mRNA.1 mitochondrial glutamyl-tRNA Gln amidotransferase
MSCSMFRRYFTSQISKRCSSLFSAGRPSWSVSDLFVGRASTGSVSIEDLRRVAQLARIDISLTEEPRYLEDLQRMVFFMERLSEYVSKLVSVEAMYSPVQSSLSLRLFPDEPAKDATRDEALANSHRTIEGFFVADKMLRVQQEADE